ncbi:MAG: glycosyltransferase [archaeon]
MKILTTNSAGNDRFGGIHTRKLEQIKYSPNHSFNIIELNHEKKYISRDNCNIHKIDVMGRTGGKSIFNILSNSSNFNEFNHGIEKLVNDYQNIIRDVNPDVILIPGTSLTSYFLFKACRREEVLKNTVHEYAGVLEKEIGNYIGDTRVILGQIGKQFVSDIARANMTYMFPSKICKEEVERIHNIKLDDSYIVWNGLSEGFSPKFINRKVPKNLTLGYIGRVHHVKNLPFFLNLNENMGRNARLNIITDLVSAASKETGKALIEKISEGEIFYYAPRDRSKLGKFYAQKLSASIVPSFFETYCNGAVESIVCGTPTLLSDHAGAKEVFDKYGLSDLVFSIDSMDSFNKALASAENQNFEIDPKLRTQIYEDLSWEKVIEKYNAIAEEVASK